jgi:hypothetical protein
MTATLGTANGKTTLTIKYAAVSTVMNPLLDSVGEALFIQGGPWRVGLTLPVVPIDSTPEEVYLTLTLAQKLSLVDAYVRWTLIEAHRQRLLRLAQKDYEVATVAAYVTGSVVLE